MSGAAPNGPCSNDVNEEEVPCSPLLFGEEDEDEEPPLLLLAQEIDLNESAISASANGTADGAADASSTISDAIATPSTVVEEPQMDTNSNLNAQIDDNKDDMSGAGTTVDASDINADEAAVPMEAPIAETTDNSDNSDTAIESNEEHKIDDDTSTVVASANQEIASEGNGKVVMNTDQINSGADADGVNDPHTIDWDAFSTELKEEKNEVLMNTDADEANSPADKVNDPPTINWDAFATELEEEKHGVSASSSGTTNDASISGNEAVETSSNVPGSTTTEVTTKGNLFQADNVDSGSTYATDKGDVYGEETSQTLLTSPDSSNTQLDDAVKVLVKFDYDLTTASNFNSATLSVLEANIASDLAQIYGLDATSMSRRTTKKRRHLRKLTVEDIIALDSKPVDLNVADTYECMDIGTDPNLTCTPISGVMTAYLEPGSDEEASKTVTAILSAVEQGMESGTYVNNEIIKVSYIGTRSNRDDMSETVPLRLEQQKSLDGLVGFVALHTRKRKRRSNNSANSIGASTEESRNTIGVGVVEIAAPANNKYDNNVGNMTMSSSGSGDEVV
eukprot:scaffold26636_cov153-Skeletonema_menzelii.AAC.23